MGYLKRDETTIAEYSNPVIEVGIVDSDISYTYFGQMADINAQNNNKNQAKPGQAKPNTSENNDN